MVALKQSRDRRERFGASTFKIPKTVKHSEISDPTDPTWHMISEVKTSSGGIFQSKNDH